MYNMDEFSLMKSVKVISDVSIEWISDVSETDPDSIISARDSLQNFANSHH